MNNKEHNMTGQIIITCDERTVPEITIKGDVHPRVIRSLDRLIRLKYRQHIHLMHKANEKVRVAVSSDVEGESVVDYEPQEPKPVADPSLHIAPIEEPIEDEEEVEEEDTLNNSEKVISEDKEDEQDRTIGIVERPGSSEGVRETE